MGRNYDSEFRSMLFGHIGLTLILCGWGCYLVALGCPAIEFGAVGLEGYHAETKDGARCFCDTFIPWNWLFAPPLFFYAGANLSMILSLFLVAPSATVRRIGGFLILFSFCISLTVPWCADEVKGVLVGCILWILSFFGVGLGFVLLSCLDYKTMASSHITEHAGPKRWHAIAGLLSLVGVAGVIVLLLVWVGNRPGKGRLAGVPPTDAENRAAAESAKPILDAIYRFQHQNGLWPNDLQELVPKYLKQEQVDGWRYTTRQDGYWKLINYAGFPSTAVQFSYLKDKGGQWELSWGDGEAELQVPYAPPAQEKLPAEEVNKRMQDTVFQRIRQNPKQVVHHKGLVSAHYRKEQFKEAREACLKCLEGWPDLWWPNVMLSLIEVRLGRAEEEEGRLLPRVEKHNDFHHWFFAAHFYHAAGQKEKCAAALMKAAQSPLDTLWVKWNDTGENLGSLSEYEPAWYGALLAYREQWLDVCLALCNRWERYIKDEKKYGAPGFNVFQAACYLNQGRFEQAQTAIEAAVKQFPNYGYHFDRQIARLRKAIEVKDKAFRYDPRDSENESQPDNWKLLVDYQ